ncbi:Ku protein [Thermosulfurimonas marina]|uniref:Non-homologous end joining protein Ku n=1 Tax=Thermosulfurimonas marina TaxID=2047767 RepID=A0A6H1WTB2_9BACT|nr:Ku protein [Thermosulfurimonas marina]QJA06411.1 Ku protein [Thermosulfurimonas marina]
MKALWSGVLKIGLVTIPVKLYQAVVKRSLSFHLVHKGCGSRINYLKYCPRCGRTLEDEEIQRAYFLDKEHFVIIEDEELENLRPASTKTLEIRSFVKPEEVPPIYYGDPYYLLPDGEGAREAFEVFYLAMERRGRAALGSAVIRQREHPFLLRPYEGKLLAASLHFQHEVVAAEELGLTLEEEKVDPRYLRLAEELVESFTEPFRPETLVDHYTQALLELIEAKAKGERYEVRPEEERAKVISFMEALEASLREADRRKRLKKAA